MDAWLLLFGTILFCLQDVFVAAMTYTYHQLKAMWRLREDLGNCMNDSRRRDAN